ncbi:hypothetical protein Pint_26781 [Pistacia integerrima]|uniref:Uncharacterized protein n=1 Tax=Pistacia integerrima TaxID=434235 RepID=A0ACC0YR30_9ROSI|nr:hypothetical protein Pint_26781 [Pistacia integerrima]
MSFSVLSLGSIPTIVVSSPHAGEQFLKTQDLVFASSPPVEAAKHIGYGQKNLSFSPYGSYWRAMRKICTLELLSSAKTSSFRAMRKEELDLLIEHIKEVVNAGVAVDLSDKVSSLSSDLTCRMVFGKKYADVELDEKGFNTLIQEGLTKRGKAIAKVFDDFLERAIDEHVDSKDENRTKDFVDVMLSFMGPEESEYKIEGEHVKAMLLVSNPRIVKSIC